MVQGVGGGYVAVGDALIYDSVDGLRWRVRHDETGRGSGPNLLVPSFNVIMRSTFATLVMGTTDGVTIWMGPPGVAP